MEKLDATIKRSESLGSKFETLIKTFVKIKLRRIKQTCQY